MKKVTGFTLIELTIVLVVLAIITATALAKFINLRADAEFSTLKGMQGALMAATDLTLASVLLHPENVTVRNNGTKRLTLDNGEEIRIRGNYPDGRWEGDVEFIVDIEGMTIVTTNECDVDTQWCVRNRGTNWFANRGIGSEGRGFIIFPNGSNHNTDLCYLYYYNPNTTAVDGTGERPLSGIISSGC